VRVVINGKSYQQREIESLSIKRALQFDRECEEHDLPWRWVDVERAIVEMSALEPKAAQAHPYALVLTALSVWASIIGAGDEVTFDEVLEMPLDSMQFVAPRPPQDHKEPADPQQARPGSGRADAPRAKAGKRKRTSAKTSRATSNGA
jgi:hypothetical protein